MLNCAKTERIEITQMSNFSSPDERNLILRLIERDEEALRHFLDNHVKRVYNFILLKIGGDEHNAEDFTQEVCIKTLNALPAFRKDSRLYTWMCAIAKNLIIDQNRIKKQKEIRINPAHAEQISNPPADNEIDGRLVRTAMLSIDSKFQEILEAKYIRKLSYKEIAKDLNVTEKSVDSLLQRAKEELRNSMKKAGSYEA